MKAQRWSCWTTEDLKKRPLKEAIEGPFDDLSDPTWLREGQAFFIARYHDAPLTLFFDGKQITMLPDLHGEEKGGS